MNRKLQASFKPSADSKSVTADLPIPAKMMLSRPIEPTEEWTVEMVWAEGAHGGPTAVLIRPTDLKNPPAGGLSQTVLRDINFKAAIEDMHETEQFLKNLKKPQQVIKDLAALAGDGNSEAYLAHLAAAYSHAVSAGEPKPYEFLGEITGKSYSAIKNNLWLATRHGLLERTPGRAGGRLTTKATDLLTTSG